MRNEIIPAGGPTYWPPGGKRDESQCSSTFFWPRMNKHIQQTRDNCRRCNEIAPSQRKEPLLRTPTPDYPFQHVVTDLFHMSGATYLIYADRYSGWT